MVIMVAIFPFVFIPGIERPFSRPKIILLGGFVFIAGIIAISTGRFRLPTLPRGFRFSLIAWASVLAVSALFGEFVLQEALWLSLFCIGWFLLVIILRPKSVHVAVAIAVTCAVTAAIALLQYMGLDPFRLFGWTTPAYGSPRMRVFGTLGNPNFVAALLVAGMPLSIYLGKLLKPRALYPVVIALETAAIFATGSRSVIAALIAMLVWLSALGQFVHWRLLAAVGLIIVVLIPFMPSRSLKDTLNGRFYIWRVTASHLSERPLVGFGPGAFEPKFIEWETGYWRDGQGSEDQRKFSGLQAHAHNDYLEILVNNGFAGLFSLLFLLGSFFVFAFQQVKGASDNLIAGASAGVIAIASVAMVDFPLHRPAELFLFWTFIALIYLEAGPEVGALVRRPREG
jgi:putative inorganic carbon (HCO3(-)) transporter